jgi:archaellum component FlaC
MQNWIVAENILALAAIITAATVLIVAIRRVSKVIKKAVHFFDDYFGEDERPGVQRRPGISERLSSMESCLNKVDERLGTVEYKIESIEKELQPNSGSSLRDAINRIEDRVETLESGGR